MINVSSYIEQKLAPFGSLSEADIAEFEIKSGISAEEIVTADNMEQIERGMAEIVPSLLNHPTSVSENGFSVTWDTDGLKNFYLYLCRKYDITPEVIAGLGIVSSYNDY